MLDILTRKEGFTLSELLVAMIISGVVMAAVFSTYYSQQKSYVLQEQVAAMQQNLRSAMFYMEREIRMAGCDPTRTTGAGITAATASSISFTQDSDADGDTSDPNETISYSLSGGNLLRNGDAIAEGIDALNFVYLDGDGTVTATTSDIRSVQITLVARTGREDPGYTDTSSYTNQQGDVILAAQSDGFRRRVLTTAIRCRNLGL